MATYYSSSNQRDAVPMLCLRENLPNSYPEAPILPLNMTSYMNSGSYSDALSGNSQQQSNCLLIPSIAASHSSTEQQEILANFGGIQTGEQNFSAWTEGQGLSLSLGNHIPSEIQMRTAQDQNPNPSFDSFLGPNPSMSSDGGYKSSSSRDESLRHSEILPPGSVGDNQDLNRGDFSLHGIAGVARSAPNSRYLKAAQQLLDEVVDIRRAMKQANIKSHITHGDSRKSSKENEGRQENEKELTNGLPSDIQDSASKSSCELSHAEKQDLQNKLAKLLSMLDEVDSRYKQYYHEMQLVVSSFDVVAGRGAAKPYTALALQTISRHFRCLHDAITGQINAMQKNLGEQDHSGNNKGVGISRLRFVDQEIRQKRALQQIGIMQHAWRPQRGLPEGSVSILRAWLFEHFLHPYPKDSDKIMLARQTGLTRSQVSNWFINARVRLWKPMIEEMYKEELGDADTDSNSSSSENASKVTTTKGENKNSNDRSDDLQRDQSLITNKTCNGGCEGKAEYEIEKQTEEQRPNFDDCGLFPHDSGGDFDRFMGAAGATSQMSEFERIETGRRGVSLTLGLQHCEGGGNFMSSSENHRSFLAMREEQDFYNATAAAASSMRAETAEFECMGAGDQQQMLSSNLVHDFVV